MISARRKEEHAVSNGAVKASPWSKALRGDSVWEDKDEFLDVIYWFRQIIAIVLGVIWGIVPLKGFVGIAISFQQIDEEEYGGTWELTKEGFMTSFALFLPSTLIDAVSCSIFVKSRPGTWNILNESERPKWIWKEMQTNGVRH
ncbi:GEL complex subunit OPTI isoform X2 [Microcaecilia unicolor]|uniref:Uncharacterized protein RAB5IF isoform X2 n=1 Tax=Microcaecilia unicolor TaxID=1415580 RepID=A0A6P7Z009_9AMPH|nr:uncharacterized protein RAB5IF isoform X2 [Microcaecilia unicolor]